jgi:hypothetical protein
LAASLSVCSYAESQITASGKSLDWGFLLYRYNRQSLTYSDFWLLNSCRWNSGNARRAFF